MKMPSSIILWMMAALVTALGIDAVLFAVDGCWRDGYARLIQEAGGSCTEFWLNRYQTFIAAIIALAGAALTVNTMWRQTERASADAAINALNRYAVVLRDVVMKSDRVSKNINPGSTEALAALKEAAASHAARLITADDLMGPDQNLVGALLDSVVIDAARKYNGQPVLGGAGKQIWPLFIAITDSITARKKHLQNGGSINDLYAMALIDENEVVRAYDEGRAPRLSKIKLHAASSIASDDSAGKG